MTHPETSAERFVVCSEARGPHWIAWLARESGGKPINAVVVIGQTREEAETSARRYARQLDGSDEG